MIPTLTITVASLLLCGQGALGGGGSGSQCVGRKQLNPCDSGNSSLQKSVDIHRTIDPEYTKYSPSHSGNRSLTGIGGGHEGSDSITCPSVDSIGSSPDIRQSSMVMLVTSLKSIGLFSIARTPHGAVISNLQSSKTTPSPSSTRLVSMPPIISNTSPAMKQEGRGWR